MAKHKFSGEKKLKFFDKWLQKYGNLKCVYCNIDTLPHLAYQPYYHELKTTLDHIIPISKGGKRNKKDNLVISCQKCNSLKGNKLQETIK